MKLFRNLDFTKYPLKRSEGGETPPPIGRPET